MNLLRRVERLEATMNEQQLSPAFMVEIRRKLGERFERLRVKALAGDESALQTLVRWDARVVKMRLERGDTRPWLGLTM